jgi:hypothetical protein
VAVKFLRADLGEDEQERAVLYKRFTEEAGTLQRLQGTGEQTGVVTLRDSGAWEADGTPERVPKPVVGAPRD